MFLFCDWLHFHRDCNFYAILCFLFCRRTLKHLEDRARKRFNTNIRAKKMINLLSSMTNSGSSAAVAGTSWMVVSTVEHGHCNPLDDTITAEYGSAGSVHMLDSSIEESNNKLPKGKKTNVELVPIATGGHSGSGGYVNELAFEERSDSKDSLNQLMQEYRLEDSDDSSQCDLKPTVN